MPDTKHCNQCGSDLPLDRVSWYFYADGAPRTPCRACHIEKAKRRYWAKQQLPPGAPMINGRRQVRRSHARRG